jgi:SNF2 family DNA or RNA helicase
MDCTISEQSTLSESIMAANEEAEAEAIRLIEESNEEKEKLLSDESESLAPVPKLLQLANSGERGMQELVKKTQDLKSKGEQLDLLLLKAESYSHFIKQNQDLSRKKIEEEAEAGSKRKSNAKTTSKSTKKQKMNEEVSKNSSLEPLVDTSIQPSNLVGGNLMPYQLEGLKWLLSLWENGLSGILAGIIVSFYHSMINLI